MSGTFLEHSTRNQKRFRFFMFQPRERGCGRPCRRSTAGRSPVNADVRSLLKLLPRLSSAERSDYRLSVHL